MTPQRRGVVRLWVGVLTLTLAASAALAPLADCFAADRRASTAAACSNTCTKTLCPMHRAPMSPEVIQSVDGRYAVRAGNSWYRGAGHDVRTLPLGVFRQMPSRRTCRVAPQCIAFNQFLDRPALPPPRFA